MDNVQKRNIYTNVPSSHINYIGPDVLPGFQTYILSFLEQLLWFSGVKLVSASLLCLCGLLRSRSQWFQRAQGKHKNCEPWLIEFTYCEPRRLRLSRKQFDIRFSRYQRLNNGVSLNLAEDFTAPPPPSHFKICVCKNGRVFIVFIFKLNTYWAFNNW
jgi:hypothetical protein